MTIREALSKRIPRIRKPEWNDKAYLRLPLIDAKRYGPWAELYDHYSYDALEKKEPYRFLMAGEQLDEDGFESFIGEKDPEEQNNFARIYLED